MERNSFRNYIMQNHIFQYLYFLFAIVFLINSLASKNSSFPEIILYILLFAHLGLLLIKSLKQQYYNQIVFGIRAYHDQDIYQLNNKTLKKNLKYALSNRKTVSSSKKKLQKITKIFSENNQQNNYDNKMKQSEGNNDLYLDKYSPASIRQFDSKEYEEFYPIRSFQSNPNEQEIDYIRDIRKQSTNYLYNKQSNKIKKIEQYQKLPLLSKSLLSTQKKSQILMRQILIRIREFYQKYIDKIIDARQNRKNQINLLLMALFGCKIGSKIPQNGNIVTIKNIKLLTNEFIQSKFIRKDIFGTIKLDYNKQLFVDKMKILHDLVAQFPNNEMDYKDKKTRFQVYLNYTQQMFPNQQIKVLPYEFFDFNDNIQKSQNLHYIIYDKQTEHYTLYPYKLEKTEYNLEEVFYYFFNNIRNRYSQSQIVKIITDIERNRYFY